MRKVVVMLPLTAALTFPVAAGAQGNEPIPPPNDMACNGLIIAYGDHPGASPAFFAQELGVPVSQGIVIVRNESDCALQK